MSLKNYILFKFLYIYNILLNFCDISKEIYLKWCNEFKYKYFDNKVLHLAFYNKDSNKYVDLYNYDQMHILIFLWVFGQIGKLINATDLTFPISDLIICKFIKDRTDFRVITDKSIDYDKLKEKKASKYDTRFIYCVVDNEHDITHYFEDFRLSIMVNKSIESQCYVNALSHFYRQDIWMKEDSELKLMMDDDYKEKVFKEKDILNIIHDG